MIYKLLGVALLIIANFSFVFTQDKQKLIELNSLVEIERAFSRTSEEKGMSAAFLEYFEKNGLAFVPQPQKVEDVFGGEETAKRLRRYHLIWQPVYGDISAAGDLGYLTGVSERKDTQDSSAPVRYGAFFSVWRRQPDGIWRVMLDCGARTPQPIAALDAPFTPSPNQNGKRKFYNSSDSEIVKLEEKLSDAAQKKGLTDAYLKFVNEHSRLHRMDQMPYVGKNAISTYLSSQINKMIFSLTGNGISKSGDLGYAYGNYKTLKNNAPNGKNEDGVFFRVWQRDASGKWKLVVDVIKASGE